MSSSCAPFRKSFYGSFKNLSYLLRLILLVLISVSCISRLTQVCYVSLSVFIIVLKCKYRLHDVVMVFCSSFILVLRLWQTRKIPSRLPGVVQDFETTVFHYFTSKTKIGDWKNKVIHMHIKMIIQDEY